MADSARRILLIESDPETADRLSVFLADNGLAVEPSGDGEAGLERAGAGGFAVLVVGRLLPRRDGVQVVRRLRDQGIATPALILSPFAEVADRVRALRLGVDDYLAAPYALPELLARIEALIRRGATPITETVLRVDDLQVDLLQRRVRRAGRTAELLPQEFRLLEYLVRNVGRVVSRSGLLQHVWDRRFDPGTNLVDVHVGRLRRKIDQGHPRPLIRTVRGVGFCLADDAGRGYDAPEPP